MHINFLELSDRYSTKIGHEYQLPTVSQVCLQLQKWELYSYMEYQKWECYMYKMYMYTITSPLSSLETEYD